ncbi:spore coat protein [Bacillus sp. AK128]
MQHQQYNQLQTNHVNMPDSTQVPHMMNHGGHEVLDMQEVISCMISTLDQYMMHRMFIKDQELIDILDRQYYFMLEEYNLTIECFQTGQKPSQETKTYMMKQSNNVTYGLKQSQPAKPMQSIDQISDSKVAGHLLGLVKASVSGMSMAALEVTNPVLRRVIADSVPNHIEMAYELFLYQNKQHNYQVPQFSQQEMTQMTTGYASINQPQMPGQGQYGMMGMPNQNHNLM